MRAPASAISPSPSQMRDGRRGRGCGGGAGGLASQRFTGENSAMTSVLVVDDDPDVLDAFVAVLAGDGYSIERASGGLPALALLDQGKPIDLLLTDVMMPG